jgi:hypothetical protein
MTWYLCTIASSSKINWKLTIQSKTWGLITSSSYGSGDRSRQDDSLLFWLAGSGYVGFGNVSEDTRAPKNISEVPWQGGSERYGLVIPMSEIIEFENPIMLKFQNRKQLLTNLDQSMFQRGFMPITNNAANEVLSLAQIGT